MRNLLKSLLQVNKSTVQSVICATEILHRKKLLLELLNDEYNISSTSTRDKGKLHFINDNHLPYQPIHNTLHDFHHMLCELETSIISFVKSITLSP